MQVPPGFLSDVTDVLGPGAVLTDPELTASYATDWTGRFVAEPPVVLRPASTADVAGVVTTARTHEVALVPQGGNTGLVAGATPFDGEVVVDLRAIAGVVDVDPLGGQLTALAGTSVATVHAAAASAGWSYGVDWAARDTATIGGSVATNAGGLRFVRHGDTRRQVMGIRAVLGTGELIDHLPRVEKDNTGLALGSLLCGSEGTLGLITAVRLRLVPSPRESATALVGFETVDHAVQAAASLRGSLPGLDAVELMLGDGIDLVRSVSGLPTPLQQPGACCLLVEVDAPDRPADRLGEALDGLGGVLDAAVAVDGHRRRTLWRYREEHTLAIGTLGHPHKFDVTLPLTALAEFIESVPRIVREVDPTVKVWLFGHAADGNIHVNVTGLADDDECVAEAVFEATVERGGSISAEHGIGRAKKRWLSLARSPGDLAAMRAIRRVLDPDGICNPAVAP